jgi:hypothetical protein
LTPSDQELKDLATKFIEKNGMLEFLDLSQGTINKILVSKGIVTVSELRDAYTANIKAVMPEEHKN